MRLMISILIVFTAVALGPTAASARGGGGDGAAAPHMSTQGMTNTNGPTSADRDTGLARAEDRESAQGLAHEKATTKPRRLKHKQEK